MSETMLAGFGLVLLAGVFQGSFLYPGKWMKGWAWENWWLFFAASAYLVCPWVLAALTVARLPEVYAGVPGGTLAAIGLFGTGWGLGALTFGLGVEAVGLALGFAVILGVAATAGAVIPLMVNPPERFTVGQGVVTGAALALMLAGVGVCSFAGKWKEKGERLPGSYRRGVAICVASGLLSACGNLGFAFGGAVAERARSLGTPEHLASNALWTLLAMPLFFWNAAYAGWLLRRNGSVSRYRAPGGARLASLAVLMGVLWMAGMALYGIGARRLGPLGPSLGWAALMSSMVMVANGLGLVSGEWREAPAEARRWLWVGIGLLLAAIATLGYANGLRG